MAKSDTEGHSALSRRDLLSAGAAIPLGLAASAVAAAEPKHVMGMDAVAAGHPTPAASEDAPHAVTSDLAALETLTVIEMEALEAFCACLIPSDDAGPGAKEARAAQYIDRALAGALMSRRADYAAGLSALDAYARSTKAQPFAELIPVDQTSLLDDLEAGKAPGFKSGSAAFFGMVRTHTIEGMFCDPYYGGNANFVGWDLIGYPGLRMMVGPEDQRMIKPKTLRESAYSAGMFGRGKA